MELAKNCAYCGTSFENWVSGKIFQHLDDHYDRGDSVKNE